MKPWTTTETVTGERGLSVWVNRYSPTYREVTIEDLVAFFAAQTPEDQKAIREAVGLSNWEREHFEGKIRDLEGIKQLDGAREDRAEAERHAIAMDENAAKSQKDYEALESDRDEWKARAERAESAAKISEHSARKTPGTITPELTITVRGEAGAARAIGVMAQALERVVGKQ